MSKLINVSCWKGEPETDVCLFGSWSQRSLVDDKPGYGQHARHPGATHHPAGDEQGRDIERLETEHSPDVEADGVHEVLQSGGGERTGGVVSSMPSGSNWKIWFYDL